MEKRKICWVVWKYIFKPKKRDGLGVGCLKTCNVALLVKWIWRLKCESNAFWSRFIIAMHKLVVCDDTPFAKKGLPGIWLAITKLNDDLM